VIQHFVSPAGELLFCQQRQKSNQKNAAPTSLPFGFPHHSTLPTGRHDSPSGLDKAKYDVHVGHLFYFLALPKLNGSANFTGRRSITLNHRSLDEAQRNPGC
jgi:hypothetical protein